MAKLAEARPDLRKFLIEEVRKAQQSVTEYSEYVKRRRQDLKAINDQIEKIEGEVSDFADKTNDKLEEFLKAAISLEPSLGPFSAWGESELWVGENFDDVYLDMDNAPSGDVSDQRDVLKSVVKELREKVT